MECIYKHSKCHLSSHTEHHCKCPSLCVCVCVCVLLCACISVCVRCVCSSPSPSRLEWVSWSPTIAAPGAAVLLLRDGARGEEIEERGFIPLIPWPESSSPVKSREMIRGLGHLLHKGPAALRGLRAAGHDINTSLANTHTRTHSGPGTNTQSR